jgi:hypothetical protein
MVSGLFFEGHRELDELLLNHCYETEMIRKRAPLKKKEAILDSLVAAIVRANLTLEKVKKCINDVDNNRVINLKFFKNGGNLFKDYIKPEWAIFARALFRQRSVGLGTPNAASGEGELMFLFLSKEIKKPTRGDLKIGDEIFELKGEQVRIMGKVRGNDFRKKTLAICKDYKLKPNKANRTNLEAVELEKRQHLDHWEKELSKLTLRDRKNFVGEWLSCLDDKKHNDSTKEIFRHKEIDYASLVNEIVKILFSGWVEYEIFDKWVMLGDGENSTIFSKDLKDFNKKVDNGEIIPRSDYFRINQPYNIGWYIDALKK